MLTPDEQIEYVRLLEEQDALLARDDMNEYASRVLGMEPAKHHRLLNAALEEVDAGLWDLLIVTMPPGSAKSSYGSVVFPAWYLGRHPNRCVIAASHTQELAERFGKRVRNIVGGAEHRKVFPEGGLSADSTAAGRWDTAKGGEYFAAGVGGSITGRRADCVLSNTLVQSNRGIVEIQDLNQGDEVLSYAEHEHRTVYRRVVAVAKREATEYWRIRTASGRLVEATGNHLFYVGGVWKAAEAVAVGDVFMSSLQHINASDELRVGQEVSGEPVISTGVQSSVCNQAKQCGSRDGAAGASHRWGQYEQYCRESCDSLQELPPRTACGGEVKTFADPVALVERVRETVEVFDIQVEETACFFAGGVLVHNCAIIDDPVKSREDADSETIREKQWAWWRDDMSTRLKPGAAVVLIMTRWHEADLAGRMIADAKDSGQRVKVLSLPMEAQENDPLGRAPGDMLWPEWFTPQMLEQAKREPRTWSALYQQEPRPIGGGEFKREWICHYTNPPATGSKVILVDPASGKSKTRGDYTAMWVLGPGQDGNFYVLDAIRDRLNLTERSAKLFELVRKWKPAVVGYEQYGLQADIEFIRNEQERQQHRFRVVELGGAIKKEDRIRRLIPLFEMGRIWFPRQLVRNCADGVSRDLIQDFIEQEYLAFPVSAHDDAIDCLARMCDEVISRSLKESPREATRRPQIRPFRPGDAAMGLLG